MNINLAYFNDENKSQIISPLYLGFLARTEPKNSEVARDARANDDDDPNGDIYHGKDQEIPDDIRYVVRIDGSELLWLSGKGLIVEGGERRYFRLQFSADQVKMNDEFSNYVGDVPCTLLIPGVHDVLAGTGEFSTKWQVLVNLKQGTKRFVDAINIKDVSGDTSSENGATVNTENEK